MKNSEPSINLSLNFDKIVFDQLKILSNEIAKKQNTLEKKVIQIIHYT